MIIIKKILKLKRDLSKTLILQNLPETFKFLRENGNIIQSFYDYILNNIALYELKKNNLKLITTKKMKDFLLLNIEKILKMHHAQKNTLQ